MALEFRRANIDDIEGIVDLCNECFEENTDYKYARDVFQKTINDDNHIYLIGVLDNKIVAHTKITIIPTIFEGMDTYAILNHACVKSKYRRKNIATKMLVEAQKIAKERGCVNLKLWSMNFRKAAHKCYKHFGFKTTNAKFFTKNIL